MAETASDKKLTCTVVTPERALLETSADFVAIPMYDGEVGIMANRAPMVGRLGCGELRIRENGNVQRYFIDAGFVQVRDNVVTVLTARALKAEKINVEAAKAKLSNLSSQVSASPEAQRVRDEELQRARAQIRMSERMP